MDKSDTLKSHAQEISSDIQISPQEMNVVGDEGNGFYCENEGVVKIEEEATDEECNYNRTVSQGNEGEGNEFYGSVDFKSEKNIDEIKKDNFVDIERACSLLNEEELLQDKVKENTSSFENTVSSSMNEYDYAKEIGNEGKPAAVFNDQTMEQGESNVMKSDISQASSDWKHDKNIFAPDDLVGRDVQDTENASELFQFKEAKDAPGESDAVREYEFANIEKCAGDASLSKPDDDAKASCMENDTFEVSNIGYEQDGKHADGTDDLSETLNLRHEQEWPTKDEDSGMPQNEYDSIGSATDCSEFNTKNECLDDNERNIDTIYGTEQEACKPVASSIHDAYIPEEVDCTHNTNGYKHNEWIQGTTNNWSVPSIEKEDSRQGTTKSQTKNETQLCDNFKNEIVAAEHSDIHDNICTDIKHKAENESDIEDKCNGREIEGMSDIVDDDNVIETQKLPSISSKEDVLDSVDIGKEKIGSLEHTMDAQGENNAPHTTHKEKIRDQTDAQEKSSVFDAQDVISCGNARPLRDALNSNEVLMRSYQENIFRRGGGVDAASAVYKDDGSDTEGEGRNHGLDDTEETNQLLRLSPSQDAQVERKASEIKKQRQNNMQYASEVEDKYEIDNFSAIADTQGAHYASNSRSTQDSSAVLDANRTEGVSKMLSTGIVDDAYKIQDTSNAQDDNNVQDKNQESYNNNVHDTSNVQDPSNAQGTYNVQDARNTQDGINAQDVCDLGDAKKLQDASIAHEADDAQNTSNAQDTSDAKNAYNALNTSKINDTYKPQNATDERDTSNTQNAVNSDYLASTQNPDSKTFSAQDGQSELHSVNPIELTGSSEESTDTYAFYGAVQENESKDSAEYEEACSLTIPPIINQPSSTDDSSPATQESRITTDGSRNTSPRYDEKQKRPFNFNAITALPWKTSAGHYKATGGDLMKSDRKLDLSEADQVLFDKYQDLAFSHSLLVSEKHNSIQTNTRLSSSIKGIRPLKNEAILAGGNEDDAHQRGVKSHSTQKKSRAVQPGLDNRVKNPSLTHGAKPSQLRGLASVKSKNSLNSSKSLQPLNPEIGQPNPTRKSFTNLMRKSQTQVTARQPVPTPIKSDRQLHTRKREWIEHPSPGRLKDPRLTPSHGLGAKPKPVSRGMGSSSHSRGHVPHDAVGSSSSKVTEPKRSVGAMATRQELPKTGSPRPGSVSGNKKHPANHLNSQRDGLTAQKRSSENLSFRNNPTSVGKRETQTTPQSPSYELQKHKHSSIPVPINSNVTTARGQSVLPLHRKTQETKIQGRQNNSHLSSASVPRPDSTQSSRLTSSYNPHQSTSSAKGPSVGKRSLAPINRQQQNSAKSSKPEASGPMITDIGKNESQHDKERNHKYDTTSDHDNNSGDTKVLEDDVETLPRIYQKFDKPRRQSVRDPSRKSMQNQLSPTNDHEIGENFQVPEPQNAHDVYESLQNEIEA